MKKILLGLFVSVLLLTGVYQVDASPVEETITRTLMEGMKGSDVSYLQTYLGIPSDGYYGPQTVTKVRNWQRQNSIFADGMFGPGSLKKLISNQNTGSVLGATADTTPRIMYWSGKINQHVDSNGVWLTDPDGSSGADIDKLTYCKKWFPNTVSVETYLTETIDTWRAGGNTGAYPGTKVSDKCVQSGSLNSNPTLSSSISATNITQTSVTLNASVISTGVPTEGTRGFCYSSSETRPKLMNGDNCETYSELSSGSFSLTFAALNPNTTYFYTAYAKNNTGTTYSTVGIFNTLAIQVTPSCTITSFNVPSTLTKGQSTTISWDTSNCGELGLESQVGTLGGGGSGVTRPSGSISVRPISTTKYTLIASSLDGTSKVKSEKTITVTDGAIPSITVISPNGGETYTAGQQILVNWKTENYNGNITEISLIPMDMKFGYGITHVKDIPNTGSYTITLPSVADNSDGYYSFGKNFKIELVIGSSQNNSVIKDLSNDTFTILTTSNFCKDSDDGKKIDGDVIGWTSVLINGVSKDYKDYSIGKNGESCTGTGCTGIVEYYCEGTAIKSAPRQCSSGYSFNGGCFNSPATPSLTVLSPNGGESYKAGDKVVFQWKTNNIPYNPDTLVSIMDDRTVGWQTRSYFGSAPALNHAKLVSSNGSEYVYEFTFIVPPSFNDTLPSKYKDIYGGNHYKMLVNVLLSGTGGTSSQKVIEDYSDNKFTITSPTNTFTNDMACGLPLTQKIESTSSSTEINGLQKILNGLGYLSTASVDGKLGSATLNAIKDFQLKNGLVADGVVNIFTINSLNKKWAEKCVGGNNLTPSIKVFSPDGGSTILSGNDIHLSWSSTGVKLREVVDLSYSSCGDGSCPSTFIKQGLGSVGNITWKANINVGTWYINFDLRSKIGVGSYTLERKIIPINIISSSNIPSITILSPNGGETYNDGQPITVKWTSSNIPNDSKVYIELSGYDEYSNMYISRKLTQESVLNDGSETVNLYKVPTDIPGLNFGNFFKIRIVAEKIIVKGASVSDYSDNKFTITSPTNTFTNDMACGLPLTQKIESTSSSTEINGLQKILNGLGYLSTANVDGKLGSATLNAIKDFQLKNGLVADGVVNIFTINSLNKKWAEKCVGGNNLTPSITLTSPKEGEIFKSGQKVLVNWNTNGFLSTDKLWLSIITRDSSNRYPFSLGAINDGQELITLPIIDNTSEYDFVVKIDGDKAAASDERRIIIQGVNSVTPTISVVRPNGSESYKYGDKMLIEWNANNIKNDKVSISLKYPDYTGSTGYFGSYKITSGLDNSGSYIWPIPTELKIYLPDSATYLDVFAQNNFKISIFDEGYPMVSGLSDVFTITSPLSTANPNYCSVNALVSKLSKGSFSDQVKSLQSILVSLGYLEDKDIDGRFGQGTRSAVIAFQYANGLIPDGVVGTSTRMMLNSRWQATCVQSQ